MKFADYAPPRRREAFNEGVDNKRDDPPDDDSESGEQTRADRSFLW